MSKALEALEQAELALSFALSSTSHAQCRDDVKKAQEAHKAIRAALEQGEAVACLICGGDGIDPDPHEQLTCCGHPGPNQECCNYPIIEQIPQPCRQCAGSGRVYTAPPSTAEQWKPSGEEYDRSIHGSTDAMEWANLFMATFPNCGACRDTMFGWFANAMMAMHDSMPSTAEAQARALEDTEILEFMERTRPTITNGPEGWSTTVRHMNSFGSGATLREAILQTMEHEQGRAEAKRIREEG